MKTIKHFWLAGLVAMTTLSSTAQNQEITKELAVFEKIVVSPKINLILAKGNQENIRIVYSNISADKIHARVQGKTLHLFLDNARVVDRRESVYNENRKSRKSIYSNVNITAYVTYHQLERLEIRGEEEVALDSLVADKKFKLKAYGESEITIASLKAEKFKASLYGRNRLKVKAGRVDFQTYHCYGENKVDARLLESTDAASHLYGEDRLVLNATHEFKISAIGQPQVEVVGSPDVRRSIVIGRANINRR